MAVRYAVATGNWSSTSTWDGGTLPTSADDVYANGFTVTIDQNVTVLTINNIAQSPAVIGGSFIINDGVSISATHLTEAFNQGTGRTLFTYNGSISANLSGRLTNYLGYVASTYYLVNHTGTGTLNYVGDVVIHARNGFVNFVLTSAGTLNYTGNVSIAGGAGEIRSQFLRLVGASAIANITGNISTVTSATATSYSFFGTLNGKLYITGTILHGFVQIINSSESSLLSIIGTISKDNAIGTLSEGVPAIVRSSASAINLFSGPFVCSRYGSIPILCVRMHLIPTISSYFEFRDETTNGALSPGAIAPATRLVSPGTAIDAPAQSNVRFGVAYSQGSLIGTLRMPTPQQVAYGVAVDNTTGSAVLTPDAVWNYLSAQLTDTGSIGARLKNVATPQTVGSQLASFFK